MTILRISCKQTYYLLAFFLGLFFISSCNLPLWHQEQLTKKMAKADIQEKTFDNGTDSIHYFEGGVGDTLVLIHGFGGDAQVTWDKSIFDLKVNYHLIVPDLLWFGKSHSSRPPNLSSQIAALTALLDDRQVKKYSVAGISYGGFVSLGMFYNDPERVSSICIIDSPGMTYNMTLLDSLCRQENVKSVSDIFVVKSPDQVQRLFDLALYKDKKIPKGIKEDIYNLYFGQHHEKLQKLIETLPAEKEKLLAVKNIAFPKSTVIWGEEDAVFPLSEGKKLAEFMGADLVQIPEAGHAPNIEKFKLFEAAFREFLATVKD